MATETVKLVADSNYLFDLHVREIVGEARDAVQSAEDILPHRAFRDKEEHDSENHNAVERRLRDLNGLLYNINMAVLCAVTEEQRETLRAQIAQALAEVNEKLRDHRENESEEGA